MRSTPDKGPLLNELEISINEITSRAQEGEALFRPLAGILDEYQEQENQKVLPPR